MEQQSEKRMRLDKWLKIARIFKTRSQASDACNKGKVMVNSQSAKAAKHIKIGDIITVQFRWKKRTFTVLDISLKSLQAEEARLIYQESELSMEEKETEQQRDLLFRASKSLRLKYKGKPTKKDRRMIRKLRGY